MFLLLKKKSSWTRCHWKSDSNAHPFFYCSSLRPLFSPLRLSRFLSLSHAPSTPRDMLLMFLLEPHCTSRAAKLTLCCHESDSSPERWCHLHTSDQPICPQALPDKTSAALCQVCVCWQLRQRSDFWWAVQENKTIHFHLYFVDVGVILVLEFYWVIEKLAIERIQVEKGSTGYSGWLLIICLSDGGDDTACISLLCSFFFLNLFFFQPTFRNLRKCSSLKTWLVVMEN